MKKRPQRFALTLLIREESFQLSSPSRVCFQFSCKGYPA